MKTAYLGNGAFGVPVLRALCASESPPLAVVTRPDRPAGRGRALDPSPPKEVAGELGIRVVEVADLHDDRTAPLLAALDADLWVVVAFPILPADLIRIPPRGVVNLHASLLPLYRGAAPVQWALINGERTTGVTTFFIDVGVDTGAICLQQEVEILPEEDAGALTFRLAEAGAALMVETVRRIAAGEAPRRVQEGASTPAPRLRKEDGLVDWASPARAICDRVRGLTPWPGAYTFCADGRLIIVRARPLDGDQLPWGGPSPAAGTVGGMLADGTPVVSAGDGGGVALLILQREGRRADDGGRVGQGLRWGGGERLGGPEEASA